MVGRQYAEVRSRVLVGRADVLSTRRSRSCLSLLWLPRLVALHCVIRLGRFLGVDLSLWWPLWRRCLLNHDALLVHLEVIVAFEFSGDRAIHQHLFPDLHFGGREVIPVDIIALCHPCIRLAMAVIRAAVALGPCCVRGAFLSEEASILSEESVEYRPSAITSFVHVIALHEELRR